MRPSVWSITRHSYAATLKPVPLHMFTGLLIDNKYSYILFVSIVFVFSNGTTSDLHINTISHRSLIIGSMSCSIASYLTSLTGNIYLFFVSVKVFRNKNHSFLPFCDIFFLKYCHSDYPFSQENCRYTIFSPRATGYGHTSHCVWHPNFFS